MYLLRYAVLLGCLGFALPWLNAQNALRFDGNGDWVNLSLTGTSLATPDPDFSLSLWFQTETTSTNPSCSGNFRRLLSLGGPSTRFEIGDCGPDLRIFYAFPGDNLSPTIMAGLTNDTWYHLCLVKLGNSLQVFLDNTLIYTRTINASSPLLFDLFRLGHWPGGGTPNQDWLGTVDELQLYDAALNPADLCAARFCPASGNEANLFAYWTFDDPSIVPGGNNTAITQVTDYSAAGTNVGTFATPATSPFALTGATSNFVANNAPVVFPALHDLGLEIRDYPYRNNLLPGICDGEPIHVCLDDNGQTPGPYSNVTVQWEQSDDSGASWGAVPSPDFIDFCFPVQPGQITVPCAGSTTGFVDRKYRAVSTVTGPTGEQCDYVSEEYHLQICCPITGANPTISPAGPFCEGETADFQVVLNPSDLFVANLGANVTVDWFFKDPASGRTPLPTYANQLSFTYPTWTAPFPPGGTPGSYCFEAEVRNCQGKLATFDICVTVDAQPVCGTIEGSPLGSPQNLTLLSTNPRVYEICPGNDAKLEIASPFLYCIPQWQYSFDQLAWTDMGLSNTIQNLNVIPGHHYPWPAGADRVYYRIQCNPLSMPSACDPCFSDTVELRLQPTPAVPLISGPTQVCVEDLPATLTISNPAAGYTYTWYHDGLAVGTGPNLLTSDGGCYWVEATNGCHSVTSAQHCLDLCETIARISCPLAPNECAQAGQPITLSACSSENTCSGNTGNALTYQWSTGDITCTITDTPPASGATYSVTVTDPVTGCVGVAQRTVVPCDF
ncbi:MAG: LamG-like jellyroll fold domain-containing protein [Bacteroidota bacterium]